MRRARPSWSSREPGSSSEYFLKSAVTPRITGSQRDRPWAFALPEGEP